MFVRSTLLVLLSWLVACSAPTPTPVPTPTVAPPVLVYADRALSNALQDVRGAFTESGGGVRVEFTFVDSDDLAARLDSSLSANIAASSSPEVFKQLFDRNRVEDVPRVFIRNPLAIVVARTNPKGILRLQDLNQRGLRVALAPADTRLGQHSRTLLVRLESAPPLQQDFAEQFEAAVIAQPSTGLGILNLIEQHRVDVGIVFASDFFLESDRVQSLDFPSQMNTPDDYTITMLKSNRAPEQLKPFIDFLFTSQAQDIFAAHGFQRLPR
jgi:molybdenum ABC transporter molybdate-binding protein